MAKLTQNLIRRFKAISPESLAKTAKECRDAAYRYRTCSEQIDAAAKEFENNNYDAGYKQLVIAEEALKGLK